MLKARRCLSMVQEIRQILDLPRARVQLVLLVTPYPERPRRVRSTAASSAGRAPVPDRDEGRLSLAPRLRADLQFSLVAAAL